eukprot:TRINITY_DN2358_c0_g1_i1.p1 TRINITY_DN2358_c0_g1~~TRINITY_DN2358_c0_g1_i1.p1  ORF type:complete len:468 (-),score=96.51 TRINITY_DN2358_c0_g1_i1:61-1428(-)
MDSHRILLFIGLSVIASHASYDVTNLRVTSKVPFDYRGLPVYKIQFQYNTGETKEGVVHRQYQEFQQLENIFADAWFGPNPPALPSDATGVDGMNSYLQNLTLIPALFNSTAIQDFLGINGAFCDGLQWFKTMEDLLYIQYVVTLPAFIPEPPIITEDNLLETPETLFECYVVVAAYKKGLTDLPFVVGLIENYTALMPAFYKPSDRDVLPPGINSITIPESYLKIPVHFQPGGYTNGRNIRISWLSKNKYNFLNETNIRIWLTKLYGGQSPKRILDIGSGYGFSTFVFGEMFPDAQVIGVDLSASNVRFTRKWKEVRGASNVDFFMTNGADTPFDANSFDIVHFSYVLHEMNANDSTAVLTEAFRLLRNGGSLSGFEVPYWYDPLYRESYVLFNTWGELGEWDYGKYGFHGPEPFMDEYENDLQLPYALQTLGFSQITEIPYSVFDYIITSIKP